MPAKTFKQPFLSKLQEELKGAVSYCHASHKIYICRDQASHDTQMSYGYEMVPVVDAEAALAELYDWFINENMLRFITALKDGATENSQFVRIIGQFEYEDY